MTNKVSLDLIRQVFFEDCEEEHDEYEYCYEEDENYVDFRVIKVGEREKPEKLPIPKYPKTIIKKIPDLSTSCVYYVKKPPKPVEIVEEVFIREKPRDVNPKKLSQKQKELFGKTLFQQDIHIIEQKKCINEVSQQETKSKKCTLKGDDILRRLNKVIQKEEKSDNDGRGKEIIDSPPALFVREMSKMMENARKTQENSDSGSIKSYLQDGFRPNRPTRSQQLKEESIRRMLEKQEVEARREALNDDLRKKALQEAYDRIQKVMLYTKSPDNTGKASRKRRLELRNNMESYLRDLETQKASIVHQNTLIGRIA